MTAAEKYLKFILCVTWADGKVVEEEITLFELLLNNSGVDPVIDEECRSYLQPDHPIDIDDTLRAVAEDMELPRLPQFIQDGYLMASSNSDLNPAQIEAMDKFMSLCGVESDNFEDIHQWAIDGLDHMTKGVELLAPKED